MYMKKILSLLLVLVTASSVLVKAASTTDEATKQSANLLVLTDSDNGATFSLPVNNLLGVHLPNERHFVVGNQQYGLESISTVTFDGLPAESVLSIVPEVGGGDWLFKTIVPGQTTLSYKRMTSYISHGGCPIPMNIGMQTISFNIDVQ